MLGDVLIWAGLLVLGYCGGVCCGVTVGIHALHCWRLSCLEAVVVLVGRGHCRLPVLVVFLCLGWVGVFFGVGVGVVAVCAFLCVGVTWHWRFVDGSLYAGCFGSFVSGVGLYRGRLLVVGGRGWGVSLVMFFSLMR